MRIVRILALALVAVFALHAATSVAQLPPSRFYGTVQLNGEVPPVDTVVEAYVGDMLCGTGSVQDLGDPIGIGYIVDVFADAFLPGCGTDGATVSLRVGGVPADQTGAFITGGFVEVDLTANGEPPPPVALPADQPVLPPDEPQP
jgi:hypothetical protein